MRHAVFNVQLPGKIDDLARRRCRFVHLDTGVSSILSRYEELGVTSYDSKKKSNDVYGSNAAWAAAWISNRCAV